eukprot:SAG31_NODE_35401_length_323_cov_1.138393_1_plen_56_part_10
MLVKTLRQAGNLYSDSRCKETQTAHNTWKVHRWRRLGKARIQRGCVDAARLPRVQR